MTSTPTIPDTWLPAVERVMQRVVRSAEREAMLAALRLLAFQAALALDHAQLMEKSQLLQRVATELATARDAQGLLDGLVERMMLLVGADGCGVWLLGEEQASAARGLSPAF